MPKRYYVAEIVGTGTEDDPYRTSIDDIVAEQRQSNPRFDVAISSIIPSHPEFMPDGVTQHPQAGRPIHTKALVVLSGPDVSVFRGKQDVDELPDVSLDVKVSAINTATKNKMTTALQKYGFNTGFISGTDGYREVIREIGKQLDPNFDENRFDSND